MSEKFIILKFNFTGLEHIQAEVDHIELQFETMLSLRECTAYFKGDIAVTPGLDIANYDWTLNIDSIIPVSNNGQGNRKVNLDTEGLESLRRELLSIRLSALTSFEVLDEISKKCERVFREASLKPA
ncbi:MULTISPECIES: hypothetical protein [Vibrio]|uniref:Uncharacterized protein n=1 Tax=Vibrio tasmaniensis TaxID=212663 RepID=A0A2N7NNE2_9VIBR|nr:hypothetical protein [Vibrio tasmaniensis]PMO80307.1 hypothetical protein BCT01_08430 [Vibrio tasmaniensis]PMP17825.1 hypothetical protein BCS92_05300 [Vibrio tasmaniensis]TKG29029.1 hypothetical protein FC057_20295 [Vibrio tasmaniensis]TKG41572.1 hypothetical protein FC063_06855 [Vibrio tasmaniensis]TKG46221.1 hypothetical protein FC070_22320 [Vibrio tasmaniensis]